MPGVVCNVLPFLSLDADFIQDPIKDEESEGVVGLTLGDCPWRPNSVPSGKGNALKSQHIVA